ncbi:MAG: hypothetical protein R3B07_10620 [Polyangiaceae bacterium]
MPGSPTNPYSAPREAALTPGKGPPPKGQPNSYVDLSVRVSVLAIVLLVGGFAALLGSASAWLGWSTRYMPLAWRKAELVGSFRFAIGYLPALAACVWFLQRASQNFASLTGSAVRFLLTEALRPLEHCWHVVERVHLSPYDTWDVKHARISGLSRSRESPLWAPSRSLRSHS